MNKRKYYKTQKREKERERERRDVVIQRKEREKHTHKLFRVSEKKKAQKSNRLFRHYSSAPRALYIHARKHTHKHKHTQTKALFVARG